MNDHPTHRLKVFNKVTGKAAEVGSGWFNPEDGRINIQLNACVVLNQKDSTSFILWPIDQKEIVNKARRKSYARRSKKDNPPDHV